MAKPRVAIVHDWMVKRGGAERVVFALHAIWPEATVYTAAYDSDKLPEFSRADVRTTWFDKIKIARRRRQLFSVPRGWSFQTLDLSDYDVVISSSSAESKYVKTGKNTLHICYCYSPTRYYWSDYDWHRQHTQYGILTPVAKLVLPWLIHYLRWQDYRLAQRVNLYVTQSRYIQDRIKRYYHRDSVIIHPGTNVRKFEQIKKHDGGFYLIVGRQVEYKRLDIAVDAFNRLGLPLVVAGVGEAVETQRSRSNANITYKGLVPEDELLQLYADAKAVVYPQVEDYGLVPVEAQAAGTPVIAHGVGGAAETVIDGQTGVLFGEQTPEGLIKAVERFQKLSFDPKVLRQHARQFDEAVFKREMKAFVEQAWADFPDKRV